MYFAKNIKIRPGILSMEFGKFMLSNQSHLVRIMSSSSMSGSGNNILCGFPVSRLLSDFVCLLIYEF